MSQKFVVVDLETTGNSPKKGDRIIQFGAVIIENGKITGKYSSLVNPMQDIPVFIEVPLWYFAVAFPRGE